MTDRVLLGDLGGGEYGLLVSIPGVQVSPSLGSESLLFDSRELEYSNAFKTGTTSLTYTGTSSSANSPTINFGSTLNYVPVVLFNRLDSSSGRVYRHCASELWTISDASNAALGDFTVAYADVTTSTLIIRSTRIVDNGVVAAGLPNGTHTFAYAVFNVGNISVTSAGP